MTFGWDYPPGVSGNEYEINGPDREYEADLYCDQCEKDVLALVSEYQGMAWWTCTVCDRDYEFEEDWGWR